jgi:hypothetical protein
MNEMNEQTLKDWSDKINSMSRIEMARMWRYAPAGHPVFNSKLPLFEIFNKRFKELGGWSPEISKLIDARDGK